jgi:hypothetical protein
MDRRDFFFKQKVTDLELDGAFAASESAQRALVSDDGISGVRSGLTVVQHDTPANLTVDVAAGTAYDPSGRRMRVPSLQVVNMAVDSSSVSTAVVNSGNSKIVGLFLKFARANSDPRTDGNGNPVNFVQNESFEFVVVQGAEASSPTAPATPADTIRLADITRTFGQTQIVNAQISVTNRKRAFDAIAGALEVHEGTTPAAIQAVLTLLNGHVTGASAIHPATAISTAALSAWKDGTTNPITTVQLQLAKFVTDLIADAGAARIGVAARTSWLGGRTNVAGVSILAAIDKVITDLAATTSNDDGAERIGAAAAGNLPSGSVRSQLNELDTIKADIAGAEFEGAVTFISGTGIGVFARVDVMADANTTITVTRDEYRFPANGASNRTIQVANPLVNGRRVRIVRPVPAGGAGAFEITRSPTGLLASFPTNQAGCVDLIADGGVWKVSNYTTWTQSGNTHADV